LGCIFGFYIEFAALTVSGHTHIPKSLEIALCVPMHVPTMYAYV